MHWKSPRGDGKGLENLFEVTVSRNFHRINPKRPTSKYIKTKLCKVKVPLKGTRRGNSVTRGPQYLTSGFLNENLAGQKAVG